MAAATRSLALVCAVAALLGTPGSARGADPEDGGLRWNPDWPKFQPLEFVVTGILGPVAIAMYLYVSPQTQPHWIGGVLFDDSIRNALRVRSVSGLKAVRVSSDVIGTSIVVLVVGVDSFVVPLARDSTSVATQLPLMDVEAFALSSIVTFSGYDSVGRARPSYVDCQHNPGFDPACNISPTASFPSGHVNEAFTAAGLSCAQHGSVPLYGGGLLDAMACARDLTLATADGVLRIMGDRHYTTDVLAGGAIGFAFGYGVPALLHFAHGHRKTLSSDWSFAPMSGAGIGVVVTGSL